MHPADGGILSCSQFQETCRTMRNVKIAVAQTVEFQEDIEGALTCVAEVAAHAEAEGASLLCFSRRLPSGVSDRRDASAKRSGPASPAFEAVLNRLPKTGPMIVMGLIEVEDGGCSTPPSWWIVAPSSAAIARRTSLAASRFSTLATTAPSSRSPACVSASTSVTIRTFPRRRGRWQT